MKPKLIFLSAWCALAATTVLGQTTYTWIGTAGGGNGTNLDTAANYTTNEPGDIPAVTLPSGSDNGTGDIIQWDNQSGGGIVHCTHNNGLPNTGGGTFGLNFVVTANQTADVQVAPVGVSTGNFGINNVTVNSASASLRLGDGTGNANTLNFVLRPGNANQLHDWVNDSANPAYIYPNVRWQPGGGVLHILDFDGTGNWMITNSLANAAGASMRIEKSGTGTMYWNGPSTANAAPNAPLGSPLDILAGTMVLQWDNFLLNNVSIVNNGSLQYDAPGQAQTVTGTISGTGNLQVNAGTLTLTGIASYSGATMVNNGTLVVSGQVGGDLDVSGGTIQPGAAGSVSTLAVGGNMNISAGTMMVALNEALSPSNSLYLVTSNITYIGGTLKLVNYGPMPTVGDTFTIFSQPVSGGAGMTIISPGFTVTNTLDSNGSVTVATVAPPAEIAVSESNGQVNLGWPAIWTGLHLQALTQPVGGGINSTNWVTIAGSDGSDSYAASLSLTNNVFYRLAP
jgi:autotransporter-associated beta strand protein